MAIAREIHIEVNMCSTCKKPVRIWSVAVLFILIITVGYTLFFRTSSLSFDSYIWKRENFKAFSGKTGTQRLGAKRDRMVDDLLKRHPFIQMKRNDALVLLGPPDFSKEGAFADWDMVYWLGPDNRGIFGALDSKWLVLKLDSNGSVVDAKVTFD